MALKIKHAERRVFRSFSTRRRENDFGEEKRKQSVVFLSLSLSRTPNNTNTSTKWRGKRF